MSWWYLADGRQIGPLDEEDFQRHVGEGLITAHVLAWCEGMARWEPFGNLVSGKVQGPGRIEAEEAMNGRRLCCQCGRAFPTDDLITYSSYEICPACKPAFFQRLSEGMLRAAPGTGGMEYGGFWIRFAAKLVDNLILGVVNTLVTLPLMLILAAKAGRGIRQEELLYSQITLQAVAVIIQWSIHSAYVTFFLGKYAATPGKMACGLRVIRSDGERVKYLRAFGRFWAEMLSGLPTLWIGYIAAGFDDQKRTLHDHICNTRVVRK